MDTAEAIKAHPPSTDRRRYVTAGWVIAIVLVAGTAFILRLAPVLAGGGLFGRGNYDDGVYYAAASGFVHGLMPYRNFVLLHPPGIVLALAPFAALADLVGDPTALAVARVAFMLLGAANAVLVAVALRRFGPIAALIGGLAYAVFFPAVYVEHTTLLEPLATSCLLGAVVLATKGSNVSVTKGSTTTEAAKRTRSASGLSDRLMLPLLIAGALLGLATTIKIWGVVPAAAMIVWALIALGWRQSLAMTAGFAAAATVVCLPFFIAAPQQMWRQVLLAQLGRPRTGGSWSDRVYEIAGLTPLDATSSWWLAVVGAVALLSTLAALQSSEGRLAVLLLAATVGLLFATPSWFLHYAALSAAPIALVLGAAAGWLGGRLPRPAAIVAVAVTIGLLAAYGNLVLVLPFGRSFPTAALRPTVGASKTCVTTDDPISLIELDVLRRNISRGCPLVVDLGGYNYALQIGDPRFRSRAKSPQWQTTALDYLSGGDTAVVGIRFRSGYGYSGATASRIRSWPVLVRADGITVRRPLPADAER